MDKIDSTDSKHLNLDPAAPKSDVLGTFFALLGDFMELCRLRSRCSESLKLKVSGRCFADNFRDSYTNLLLYGSRNTFFGNLPGLGAKLSQNHPKSGSRADTKFGSFSPLGLQWCPKSPDAVKLCPQTSKSCHCGPKTVLKWYPNWDTLRRSS